MAEQNKQKGDVIFPQKEDGGDLLPKKDDDGELRPPIPSKISDAGELMRDGYQKKSDGLFSKLKETFGTIRNSEEHN